MARHSGACAIRMVLWAVLAERDRQGPSMDRTIRNFIGPFDLPGDANDGGRDLPVGAALDSDLAGVEVGATPQETPREPGGSRGGGFCKIGIREAGIVMENGNNKVVVIWIDWYAYHVARFRALHEHQALQGRITGLELVGGAGVHQGMVFREAVSEPLPIKTLAPKASWSELGQRRLGLMVWRELEKLQPEVVLVPGYYTLPGLSAALWAKWRGRRSVL